MSMLIAEELEVALSQVRWSMRRPIKALRQPAAKPATR